MALPRLLPLALLAAVVAASMPGPTVAAPVASGCFTDAKWSFCYNLDDSRGQGLELNTVAFDGTPLLFNIGFPFSITAYEDGTHFKDILGTSASTVPGYGNGALTLTAAQCPRFLGTGTVLAGGRICYERQVTGPDPRVVIWSRFDIFNYRYIQAYELRQDGTFLPKILLGGALIDSAECSDGGGSTCLPHLHYLYWRIDMDVGNETNDRFQQFARKTENPTSQHDDLACADRTTESWCSYGKEALRNRRYNAYTKWRQVDFDLLNAKGHPMGLELTSTSQGSIDAVSTHDVWALRYKCMNVWLECEMGYQVGYNPANDTAINAYADGESINRQDLVLWYSQKVHHEPRDEDLPTMAVHEAGPILRVRNVAAANPGPATYP